MFQWFSALPIEQLARLHASSQGAIVVLAICLALAGITAWRTGVLIDRQRIDDDAAMQQRLTTAEAVAEDVRGELSTARTEAVDLRRILAETRQDAERARQSQVPAGQRPRIMDVGTQQALVATLGVIEGRIFLLGAIENDPEARQLADALRGVLLKAEWPINAYTGSLLGVQVEAPGITLQVLVLQGFGWVIPALVAGRGRPVDLSPPGGRPIGRPPRSTPRRSRRRRFAC